MREKKSFGGKVWNSTMSWRGAVGNGKIEQEGGQDTGAKWDGSPKKQKHPNSAKLFGCWD